MVEPVAWKNLPDTSTPLTAETLLQQQQWVLEQRAAAEDSAVAAAASAAEAAAPADDQVAGLIGSVGTATRTRLDAQYATSAALTALQGQSASIEDLFMSATLATSGAGGPITIAVTGSTPVFVAPFPLRITSAALVHWTPPIIPTSDVDYWLVSLRKGDQDGTTHTVLADKTTRLTAGDGLPIGTPWPNRIPWKYDTELLVNAEVAAGQTINFGFYTTGAPQPITGPVIATIGYQPL